MDGMAGMLISIRPLYVRRKSAAGRRWPLAYRRWPLVYLSCYSVLILCVVQM